MRRPLLHRLSLRPCSRCCSPWRPARGGRHAVGLHAGRRLVAAHRRLHRGDRERPLGRPRRLLGLVEPRRRRGGARQFARRLRRPREGGRTRSHERQRPQQQGQHPCRVPRVRPGAGGIRPGARARPRLHQRLLQPRRRPPGGRRFRRRRCRLRRRDRGRAGFRRGLGGPGRGRVQDRRGVCIGRRSAGGDPARRAGAGRCRGLSARNRLPAAGRSGAARRARGGAGRVDRGRGP